MYHFFPVLVRILMRRHVLSFVTNFVYIERIGYGLTYDGERDFVRYMRGGSPSRAIRFRHFQNLLI